MYIYLCRGSLSLYIYTHTRKKAAGAPCLFPLPPARRTLVHCIADHQFYHDSIAVILVDVPGIIATSKKTSSFDAGILFLRLCWIYMNN